MPRRAGSSPLAGLAKVEHHRHLDGSIRHETLIDIARRHGLAIALDDQESLRRRTRITEPLGDVATVLEAFETIQQVTCSYEAIRQIAFENVEDAWRDGCVLAELRFSPAFIAMGKAIGYEEIIEGVLDGVTAGMARYPIEIGLITIVSRTLDYEANLEGMRACLRYAHAGRHPGAERLVGFDLADREATTSPGDWLEVVGLAREAGWGVTVHSGEETPAAAVRETVEVLAPDRIGHGVNAWQDPRVVRLLIERDVLLELCPTSNWLTQCVPTLDAHPLPQFYRAGVKVSINSDDPELMDIDLVNEYELAQRLLGLGPADFHRINLMALEKSFLPEEIRAAVKARHFD